ncbi:non-canonical purine NTP pyrophosphatase [Patescibacteria group bacterium]|nr:non-canonical purine NTP pyrophosphatase [Patescibacteria group bacterium]MBU1472699.1 non-canonical purine NTP pyrophosphatase [Patescibacteria group bacterium]MBU2459966.1 non-canonical purine NTP pyrophosphatase [Patescibacteria group bacterium]MBU2544376.1 non-canonical purine NTP pyrophosphatase [Patescibacteria group bacterium]
MRTLLIATTNPGKLGEIRKYLSDLSVELVSLKDAGISDSVNETGKTFEENAILKAKFYCQKSGLPTLSDDGGFEIDALNGEPGVKSHRWIHGDRDSTDEELIRYTFKQMKGLPRVRRGAQLRLVLAFALPDGQVFTQEGKIHGIVPLQPSAVRHTGFPYRSILFIPELNKYYDHEHMTEGESKKYNHRRRALEKMKPRIKKILQEEKE